jgi:uncharacterized protein involved in exopolysaccharide biosynthesis
MEFHSIWRILARRKHLLIWLPLIATCVGLGLTFVLPEQYESTALVIVRPFEDIKFNSSDADKREIPAFPVSLTAPVDAPSKTYMEVIKSPAVAIMIVEALGLHVKEPKKTDGRIAALQEEVKAWARGTLRAAGNFIKYGRDIPASAFDLAVEDVEKNLVVAARKDTYAFAIAYRASDPKEAAAVANKAAEIFLERSSEAYRSESARAREFIETQVRASSQALEHARADTLAYKKLGQTFELTAEYNEKLRNISDLENTLAKTEGKLAGRQLVDARIGIKSPVMVATSAEIAELKGQISSLRLQLESYPSKETKSNDIHLAERIAEQNYEFYRKQYEEARVKESATVTEIRIVSPAVPTLYPVKPLKFVYAGMSFVTAMVLAVGWALVFGTR